MFSRSVFDNPTPIRRRWLPREEWLAQRARERELFVAARQQEKQARIAFRDKYPSEYRAPITNKERVIAAYKLMSQTSNVAAIVNEFDDQDLGDLEPFIRLTIREMAGELASHAEFETKLLWIRERTKKTIAQILEDIFVARWPMVYKWKLAGPPYQGLRSAVNALWRKHGAGGFTPYVRKVVTFPPNRYGSMFGRRGVRRVRPNNLIQPFWNALAEQTEAAEADAMRPEFWQAFDAQD